jgi:DNA-binding MarR family transcriptional regulator
MITDHVVMLIAGIREKAYRFLVGEMSTRGMTGLAPSHGAILSTLFDRGPVRMQELASRIDRDKSTVTALVRKLVEHGHVQKVADPEDNRAAIVRLTARGEALRPDFDDISERLISVAFRGFERQEKESLIRSLEKMLESFRREVEAR